MGFPSSVQVTVFGEYVFRIQVFNSNIFVFEYVFLKIPVYSNTYSPNTDR